MDLHMCMLPFMSLKFYMCKYGLLWQSKNKQIILLIMQMHLKVWMISLGSPDPITDIQVAFLFVSV